MENINLIRHHSWSFQRSTGFSYEDLFSEACLAYCEALTRFDPNKGKLNNYATTLIQNKLRDFVRIENRYVCTTIPETSVEYTYIKDFVNELPKKVRDFAQLILNNLEDVDDTLSPCQARIQIRKVLIEQGFDKRYVNNQMKALKEAINKI